MNDTIFGYAWDDIQRAQQGGSLARTIDTSKPAQDPPPTDADLALLAKHGSDGLRAMQYHGTIGRLEAAKLI